MSSFFYFFECSSFSFACVSLGLKLTSKFDLISSGSVCLL